MPLLVERMPVINGNTAAITFRNKGLLYPKDVDAAPAPKLEVAELQSQISFGKQ